MALLHQPQLISLEEFIDGADDEERYAYCEYWDGEVIPKYSLDPESPLSPRAPHGLVQTVIGAYLTTYLFEHRGLGVPLSEVLVRLPNRRRMLQPDLMVIRPADLVRTERGKRMVEGVPLVVVEILSPTDRAGAVQRKIAAYLEVGVPLVWLVDPQLLLAWAHRPGQEARELAEALDGEDVLPGFTLPLPRLLELWPAEPSDRDPH